MTRRTQKAMALIREQVQAAHQLLEGTLGELPGEEIHWTPAGVAHPIGATYAHVVISEDGTINGLLKGGVPLFAGAWANRTGLSELPPGPDPNAPGFPDWSGWGRRVKVNMAALRQYAQAVYAASDEYLAARSDEDLNRPLNLAALGLGESTVGYVLNNGVLGHAFTHCGEISCLKGLRGARGYPR